MLALNKQLGYDVVQEKVPYLKFKEDLENGTIVEAGGLGTGAGVCPVGMYVFDDHSKMMVKDSLSGPITTRMYQLLMDIQQGKTEAPEGWLRKVPKNM